MDVKNDFKAHDSLEDVKATLYCYNKIINDKGKEEEHDGEHTS